MTRPPFQRADHSETKETPLIYDAMRSIRRTGYWPENSLPAKVAHSSWPSRQLPLGHPARVERRSAMQQ